MIDIHSHILPGLDDGARNLEQSVEMVRLAARHGTTDIVASPHANSEFEYSPERVRKAIAELAEASGNVLRIHSGCDFHVSADNLERALVSPAPYTINGGAYLLVELPDFYSPPVISGVFERLQGAGALPIVTHPERNSLVQSRIADVEEWVTRGAFVQVTGQSFLGRFGSAAQSFAGQLIRRGLVHFIASDAHDPTHRPPVLDEVHSYISKKYGDQTASLLLRDNPAATLAGGPVCTLAPAGRRRRWFHW